MGWALADTTTKRWEGWLNRSQFPSVPPGKVEVQLPSPPDRVLERWDDATGSRAATAGEMSDAVDENTQDERDQSKELYNLPATPLESRENRLNRILRATLGEIINEFNRHSNTAYAAISVNAQQPAQVIAPDTSTKVNAWHVDGANDRATSDSANDQIILGDSGNYLLGASVSYAHTGGPGCDMTWAVFANGSEVPSLKGQLVTSSGDAASVSIGPLIVNAPTDNMTVDVRVVHSESGDRNLIVGSGQFTAMRVPTLPVRTFNDLRTAIDDAVDSE